MMAADEMTRAKTIVFGVNGVRIRHQSDRSKLFEEISDIFIHVNRKIQEMKKPCLGVRQNK